MRLVKNPWYGMAAGQITPAMAEAAGIKPASGLVLCSMLPPRIVEAVRAVVHGPGNAPAAAAWSKHGRKLDRLAARLSEGESASEQEIKRLLCKSHPRERVHVVLTHPILKRQPLNVRLVVCGDNTGPMASSTFYDHSHKLGFGKHRRNP